MIDWRRVVRLLMEMIRQHGLGVVPLQLGVPEGTWLVDTSPRPLVVPAGEFTGKVMRTYLWDVRGSRALRHKGAVLWAGLEGDEVQGGVGCVVEERVARRLLRLRPGTLMQEIA